MAVIRITCPHCGFARDTAKERIPARDVQVTCPSCKQRFPLSLTRPAAKEVEIVPAQPSLDSACSSFSTRNRISAAPSPEPVTVLPEELAPLSELPIRQGGAASKKLLLFFLILVVVLVGARLWADSKMRNVPFPNFIAGSDRQVAVSWGQEIYLLDHAGNVLRKETLPPDVILTQMQFVGDELWVGNYAAKSVQRLRNHKLETVANGDGKIRGTFKFAADIETGEIFITDASNHRVHVYSSGGKYLRTFGKEGKGSGEFMFPNSVVFDRDRNLLIVNTNAHRLDLFSRNGHFLKTLAQVKSTDHYCFPTLLTQVGNRLAFLLTVDLRQARVVMYGDDGLYLGEFRPPVPIHESGDVAACDGNVLVTDNEHRKIYRFKADTLAYAGPFSAELDSLGAKAKDTELFYRWLSKQALVGLLVACVPVFFLYYRMKRREQSKLETRNIDQLIPPGAILGTVVARNKLALSMLMVLLSLLLFTAGRFYQKKDPSRSLLLVSVSVLPIVGAIRFMGDSGYGSPCRKDIVERLAKAAFPVLTGMLSDGEKVERCTVVHRNASHRRLSLLICTSRRVLLIDFASARPVRSSQLGYGDITGINMQAVAKLSKWVSSLIKVQPMKMTVALDGTLRGAPLHLHGQDQHVLEQVGQFFETKRSNGESLGYCDLCSKCYHPLGPSGCPRCRQEKENWKPLVLSLCYPGVGQFYNREIGKGAFVSVIFTAGILLLTRPIITMVDHSAEFSSDDVLVVVKMLLTLLFVYVAGAADADSVGRKGRQLFSRRGA